jgi:hypothetical protein
VDGCQFAFSLLPFSLHSGTHDVDGDDYSSFLLSAFIVATHTHHSRFPHGCCYSTMAILSAAGGLLMNLYVIGSCFFMRVTQINPVNGDPVPGSERGYGFLAREVDYGIMPDFKQCVYYPQAEYDLIFDGWMHTGRLFAFLSAILSAVCFMVLFCTCCCAFSPSMFERWLFWMYISAAICIALSMFAYGCEWCSESECKVADGTGWAISAFMFHLVSANTVKSFAAAGPPTSRNVDEQEDANDEDLDDLYYEREEDKYPPPHPNGPRGIVVRKNGKHEFDNGEDYFDDMGRMHNPHGDDEDRGDYRRARKFDTIASADLNDADLDDISDHDLDQYASDSDDDDEVVKEPKFDEKGNRIYDPKSTQKGNLGVGYEEEHVQFDEFGNPLDLQQPYNDGYNGGNPAPYGSPEAMQQQQHHQPYDSYDQQGLQPEQQYDAYGNAIMYDEYGNPYLAPVTEEHWEGEYDETQQQQQLQHQHQHQQEHDHHPDFLDEQGNPVHQNYVIDEQGNPVHPHHQAYDEYGNPIVNDRDDDGRAFA